ncbi:MAG: ABC transporter permease [Deltaproteobacteria bacterium]|nr:ABC transporter permease [Deltaproteobacteria bacterium]
MTAGAAPYVAPDPWRAALRSLLQDRSAVGSLLFLVVVTLLALFADAVSPYAYDHQDTGNVLASPGLAHWLGTDSLGRDLLTRLIHGARISMAVGVAVGFAGLALGAVYGGLSGWIGGRTDDVLMRIVDVVYSFPGLLLMVVFIELFKGVPGMGEGLGGIMVALSIIGWVSTARLVRALVLQLREETYVESARALGASGRRILLRHILPNALGPLLVILTYRIPVAILSESTLSFIGLGIQPPLASWGTLAYDGWGALRSFPHLLLPPALAIFFTILAFNFLGDRLRDALDPTLRDTP